MSVAMTGKRAGVCGTIIGDGRRTIWTDHIRVEIHQSLAGYGRAGRAHSMRYMAD